MSSTPTTATCPICNKQSLIRIRSQIHVGGFKVAWFEHCQIWSVAEFPSSVELHQAYQNFNAGELARDSFELYLEQARSILIAELGIAGIRPSQLSGLRFLDYGCGGGHFVGASQILGMESVGLEIDKTSVANARARGLAVINGVLPDDRCQISPEKFDVIKVSHVLEHLTNLHAVLSCLVDLLKSGGVLIVNVPNQESIPSRLKILLRYFGLKRNEYGYVQPPIHLHGFTRRSLGAIESNFPLKLVSAYEYSPLDKNNFPTSPEYWNNLILQKMIYSISAKLGSGGYMTGVYKRL